MQVRFINRKGQAEAIEANNLRQAVAIGKSWSVRETFAIYDEGIKVTEFRNGSEVGKEVNE